MGPETPQARLTLSEMSFSTSVAALLSSSSSRAHPLVFSDEATRGVLILTLARSYVGSRFYLPDPPHERKAVEPEVNSLACFIFLAVTVVLMGVTTEFVRHPLLFILNANVLTASTSYTNRAASARSTFFFSGA
jgi:hypothetical protein